MDKEGQAAADMIDAIRPKTTGRVRRFTVKLPKKFPSQKEIQNAKTARLKDFNPRDKIKSTFKSATDTIKNTKTITKKLPKDVNEDDIKEEDKMYPKLAPTRRGVIEGAILAGDTRNKKGNNEITKEIDDANEAYRQGKDGELPGIINKEDLKFPQENPATTLNAINTHQYICAKRCERAAGHEKGGAFHVKNNKGLYQQTPAVKKCALKCFAYSNKKINKEGKYYQPAIKDQEKNLKISKEKRQQKIGPTIAKAIKGKKDVQKDIEDNVYTFPAKVPAPSKRTGKIKPIKKRGDMMIFGGQKYTNQKKKPNKIMVFGGASRGYGNEGKPRLKF